MATVELPEADAPGGEAEAERATVLIRAASDLMEEGGLEGLTIRAVLQRTGLARRAFYEQFNGKDDLVLAVFERTIGEAANHFSVEADEVGDPVEALRRIVVGLVMGPLRFSDVDEGRRSAALSREHLRLAESRPQELQAALMPLLDLVATQIAQGVGAGVLRPCDPHEQARLVYNLVASTVHVELLATEGGFANRERRSALAETIWEFCRRALIA